MSADTPTVSRPRLQSMVLISLLVLGLCTASPATSLAQEGAAPEAVAADTQPLERARESNTALPDAPSGSGPSDAASESRAEGTSGAGAIAVPSDSRVVEAASEAAPENLDAGTSASSGSAPVDVMTSGSEERPGTTVDTLDETSESSAVPAASPIVSSRKSLPHNLSPWGMFEAADVVVKTVMIGLALASFITWTVWVAKAVELAAAKRRLRRAAADIDAADSLSAAVDRFARTGGPGGALVRAAAEELSQSATVLDHTNGEGLLARVTSRLSRVEAAAARRITRGTGVLATIGATAPFVGLFGTVWGIMNSFIGISEAQTTNLAVVAPGIAEALLATALGLVAAIPAVIIYNAFSRSIAGYRQLLADAAAGVERLVSRDLDFRRVSPAFALAAE